MNNIINQNKWPELNEGDPLADAVIADWLKASPEGKNWLLEGVRNGAHSIPQAPASYHALLTQAEGFLRTTSFLDLAPMPYLYASPMWISVSMGPRCPAAYLYRSKHSQYIGSEWKTCE